MDLANRIMQLRTARGLSQLELAEQLNVSRQSVSKWETAQSVPELEKLVALSDLFGITLDELVRGEGLPTADAAADAAADDPAENPYLRQNEASVSAAAEPGDGVSAVQRTVGYICLAVGLLSMVLGLLFGGLLLVLGAYIAICGGILIWVRRYAWLPILFLTLMPLMLVGPRVMRFTVYWQLFNVAGLLALFVAVAHFIRKNW